MVRQWKLVKILVIKKKKKEFYKGLKVGEQVVTVIGVTEGFT